MRRGFWLAALLPALGGCYMAPQDGGYGYAQPNYPAGAYVQPGYAQPVYRQPVYDPYAGYPGYSEYNGQPAFIDGGMPMPLVMFGSEWGFYDSGRRWHRAPEGISRHMEERRGDGWGGGGHFHPNAASRGEAFPQHRQEGRPGGERFGGQAAFRPAEQQRPAPIQAAPVHLAPVQTAPQAAPAAQPRQAERERRRDCPPGQRC